MSHYPHTSEQIQISHRVGDGVNGTGSFAVFDPQTVPAILPGESSKNVLLPIRQTASPDALTLAELQGQIEAYLQDLDLRLYSPDTIKTRRDFLRNLVWFLNHRGYPNCGLLELRQFFHYLGHGHEEPGGRFGKKSLTRPARPVTVVDYYHCLRSLFNWMLTQGTITETPFTKIAKPQMREELKSPLSPEQVAALLKATEQSADPVRNIAIVTFLLDT